MMPQRAAERFLDRLAADLDRSIREYRIAERRLHADPDGELYARPPRYGGIVRRADVVAWVAQNAVDAAAWRLCRAEEYLVARGAAPSLGRAA
jgi:hypothetical protein